MVEIFGLFFSVIVHPDYMNKAQFELGHKFFQCWKGPDLQDGIHQQSAPKSEHYFSGKKE